MGSNFGYDDGMRFMSLVAEILRESNPSGDRLNFLLDYKGKDLRKMLFKFLREPSKLDAQEYYEDSVFPVEVDYSLTVSQMVAAAGFYLVDKGISQRHFSVRSSDQKKTINLQFAFFENLPLSQIKSTLVGDGSHLAGLPELLAFAKAFPDWQRKFPIVELRNSWRKPEGEHFLCLEERRHRRFGTIFSEDKVISGSVAILLFA